MYQYQELTPFLTLFLYQYQELTPFPDPFSKSLEGTLAFAGSAIVVVLVIAYIISAPISFVVIGVIAGLVGALVENISPRLRLDDNISIPGSVGLTMLILTSLISSVPTPH